MKNYNEKREANNDKRKHKNLTLSHPPVRFFYHQMFGTGAQTYGTTLWIFIRARCFEDTGELLWRSSRLLAPFGAPCSQNTEIGA
jgi:hypothetical protein